MDSRKMKIVTEWLRDTVFTDEAIRPRAPQPPSQRLPVMLRTARSLETGGGLWQSRESTFLKQGRFLVNYEDDCEFEGTVRCYYPTYQSLTDRELRGYFTWRTKLRRGEVQKTSLSYAFLYIYELLNQIGVKTPQEGYDKLRDFRTAYGQLDEGINSYLERWLTDYVVYYELDPSLLADSEQVRREQSIAILENIQKESPEKIMDAVKQLSPKWLGRSRFYANHQADMDTVIVATLRRVSDHCDKRCKKTMTEQYFGTLGLRPIRPFDTAVFTDPLKRRQYEYVVTEHCVYQCKNGMWLVQGRDTSTATKKMDDLLKCIDARMRAYTGDKKPIQSKLDTKWILKIVEEEIEALDAAKKAAEALKVTINYAQLTQIRRDAEFTQEKLIVDEEMEEPAEPTPPILEPDPEPAAPADTPLTDAEYRLVQCLLYGGGLEWVQQEGHMLSVLADGVNEKLYDTFLDSVLDDTPQVIEDYTEDLKEMVRP